MLAAIQKWGDIQGMPLTKASLEKAHNSLVIKY